VRKRTLKNWVGEDWTINTVEYGAPELQGNWGICDLEHRRIFHAIKDNGGDGLVLLHEATHRALEAARNEDEPPVSELRVDYAAYMLYEFLRKMGVDLSPLVE
jgi:hypothetical protein